MMTDVVLVALISFAGNLIGVFMTNKLTQYRIDKLEESVKKLSDNQEKIVELDTHNQVQDEKIKNLERIAGVN